MEKSYSDDADIGQEAAAIFKLAQLVPVVVSDVQEEFALQSTAILLAVENAVEDVGKESGAFLMEEILCQWPVAL